MPDATWAFRLSCCSHADSNEIEIAKKGGIAPIIEAARSGDLELESQAARALRNLSVNDDNKVTSACLPCPGC